MLVWDYFSNPIHTQSERSFIFGCGVVNNYQIDAVEIRGMNNFKVQSEGGSMK